MKMKLEGFCFISMFELIKLGLWFLIFWFISGVLMEMGRILIFEVMKKLVGDEFFGDCIMI